MPDLKRRKVPWKDREHAFTPYNITRLELAFSCSKRYPRREKGKIRVRCPKHGKVIWIMRGGEIVK